jgi:hypothetical protein
MNKTLIRKRVAAVVVGIAATVTAMAVPAHADTGPPATGAMDAQVDCYAQAGQATISATASAADGFAQQWVSWRAYVVNGRPGTTGVMGPWRQPTLVNGAYSTGQGFVVSQQQSLNPSPDTWNVAYDYVKVYIQGAFFDGRYWQYTNWGEVQNYHSHITGTPTANGDYGPGGNTGGVPCIG